MKEAKQDNARMKAQLQDETDGQEWKENIVELAKTLTSWNEAEGWRAFGETLDALKKSIGED